MKHLFSLAKFLLLVLSLSIALGANPIYAQVAKFGKVEAEDFQTNVYPLDSSASAIVLFETGNTTFQYIDGKGMVSNLEVHRRIKILKKTGYDQADISFGYYFPKSNSDREKVSDLKGYTYRLENGKVEKYKLERSSIFEEQVTENYAVTKFTMPQIAEGAIFEYTYKIQSPYLENLSGWYFQGDIPALWSEYEIQLPEYYTYKTVSQGYYSFTVNESKQSVGILTGLSNQMGFLVHKWAIKDIPAFKNEKYITTPKDYMMRVSFQLSQIQYPNQPLRNLSTSWEEVTKRYRESDNFGVQLKKNGLIKDIAASIKGQYKNPEEQIDAAYKYLQKNFKWNEKRGEFTDLGVRKAFQEKTGNSADLNLLLIMILREMEIEANPVLLSTRSFGKVNILYPSIQQFNHIITYAEIGEGIILLDAISKDTPTGVLPYECLNDQGLVIKDNGHEWLSLYSLDKSVHLSNSILKLNKNGIIEGTIQTQDKLYIAISKRSNINELGQEAYIKQKWLDNTSIKVNKYNFKGLEDAHTALNAGYQVEIETDQAGERIYWSPFIKNPYSENPFKQEERRFPIDFGYPFQEMYLVNLTIPENYTVEELPKSQIYRLPNNSGEFSYSILNQDKNIQFRSTLTLTKPIYEPVEYAGLKELFTLMVAKFGEQIVLKKTQE